MQKSPKNFNPEPFDYHQEVELTIDTLTNLGQGLGRIDGWVVIVPFALAGEKILARVYRNHKNYSDADLVEILEPSPDRIEPQCELFGQCGGCQYQNLAYPTQVEWKRRQVAELLQHMAGIEFPVNEVITSPRQYNYRSKITPHFQKPRGGKIDAIGFLIANRRQQILDVPSCPIAMESINQKLTSVREKVHLKAAGYKKGATLLLRASADEQVITDPKATATEQVGDLKFSFLAGDFFQNNPFILPAFTDYVREQAVASGAKFLVDAYCGSGLFTLTAAPAFERATGIEVSEGSIKWAKKNAAANQIANCEFLAGEVEDLFANVTYPGQETSIIIDPPRKGSSPEFLSQLFRFGPRSVVYVSCNPATQMRDLKLFTEAGYQLEAVQPFDLFPQTRHLECVMTLTKS
ncbi:MAG: tRNA/tmRNA/rRNA uracil-C5-methylase (TrmA/RlmC/RlmD family) [Verrucomicrobiales bacterium]|jgi:tRNA/tmRNA/rRNA uracil-C5-methylase (TrmA/RlmC/RlmD family)